MVQTNIQRLHSRLSVVCPIDGVSIGDPDDKATYRVDYAITATDDQKAAADAVLVAFEPNEFTNDELKIMAFQKAADYVAQFFSDIQLTAMESLLLSGSNAKAVAILQWIGLVRGEALANWSNPNFDQFTPPPYRYEEVMGVTLT